MSRRKRDKSSEWESPSEAAPTLGDLLKGAGINLVPREEESTEQEHGAAQIRDAHAESNPFHGLRGKVVVRFERKGRGGKTVTLVTGLNQPGVDLSDVARELRKSLGTGTRVEGDKMVIQGDQRERVKEWLFNKGIRTVVLG